MSLVDLGKRLLEAAKRGDTDEVRTLMTNGAPFTTDWLGTSPLHFAAQSGHKHTAEVLLRAGISRDARTKVDRTPLHVAAQEGHVAIVDTLLANAADVDAKDMLKMTPLHWASEKGHMAVVESLVKHGADVTCENKFDKTPLDIAIHTGQTLLVPLLQGVADSTVPITETEPETVTIETSETTIATNEVAEMVESNVLPPNLVDQKNAHVIPLQVFQNQKVTDGTGDQNSTQVLATLAALAEATAPNSTQNNNNAEVMNWLESQGITMISTADSNIISSAVESGHTISLTDAGKIALNIIQEENENSETVVNNGDGSNIHTIVADDGTENVFTIVPAEDTDDNDNGEENQVLVNENGEVVQGEIEIDRADAGIMLEDGNITHLTTTEEMSLHESQQFINEDTEPPVKRIKLEPEEMNGDVDISTIVQEQSEQQLEIVHTEQQLEIVHTEAQDSTAESTDQS